MSNQSNVQALAYIDLLGFSQMVGSNSDRAKEILNDFYNITYHIIKENNGIKGDLFSDSLLAYSSQPDILVNAITEIYRECLKKNETYAQNDLSKYFLLPRGGISYGMVDIQERSEAPNLTKNFIVSPALIHSSKIEGQIKGSRLLIADTENANDSVFNWNNKIKSILYENSTFTLLSNYKYSDALWFLNLNKKPEEQEQEVKELIEIAIKLVKSNSDNPNAIEQHLQTLRIGLLSYTKFGAPTSNDPILRRIVSEFEEDKYWLIWLTVFETFMQSLDNWAVPSNRQIIEFYKKVCLKSSWSNVIEEIHKPNNTYLNGLLNTFIKDLQISNC